MHAPPIILVVDDSEDVLYAVTKLLKLRGYRVEKARNGREALQAAKRFLPDLILLDVIMPDMDGFEALQLIRADPELADSYVVHLSAMEAPVEQQMRGLKLGADGYVRQPVENEELIARVEGFLRHKATMDQLRESEERYRVMFEANPQPMWISDRDSSKILAANSAALRTFGLSREKFLGLQTATLLENAPEPPGAALGLPPPPRPMRAHKMPGGETLEFEIVEQELDWGGTPSRATLAIDVTERVRAEREKFARLEIFLRELDSLARLNTGDQRHADLKKTESFRARNPADFSQLLEGYIKLLEAEYTRRVYRVNEGDDSTIVRNLADRLYTLGTTGRDVIELHYTALKKLAPTPDAPKAQGYLEVARLTILEMLSHLLFRYRTVAKALETIRPGVK